MNMIDNACDNHRANVHTFEYLQHGQTRDILKVSVLIFTYNRCALLKRALNSIFAQSIKADEIIVVDGGSNDGTREVVSSFNGVGIVEISERNEAGKFVGSLAHSVNEGFRLAKNELVLLLADDIILLPDCMRKLAEDIQNYPDYAGWVCRFGETTRKMKYGVCDNALILNMGVIKKSVYYKVGCFDEQYQFYGWDLDFSLSCWHKGYSLYPSKAGILHFYAPNDVRSNKESDVVRLATKYPYSRYEHLSYRRFKMRCMIRSLGFLFQRNNASKQQFLSYEYMRHNYRRLEHLAGLGLQLRDKKILEVGAGIGDLTSFFLDRGCRVVSTDARAENLKLLCERYPQKKYPQLRVRQLDLEDDCATLDDSYDVVFCYGTLYHLKRPAEAIEFMAQHCDDMMLLETIVSFGVEPLINPVLEQVSCPSQAYSGVGCRPSRSWVYNQLKQHFEYVYVPRIQPNDEQFPLNWNDNECHDGHARAVFIGTRRKLHNPNLECELIMRQERQM